MEITEVKLTLRNENKLKGFANITFDNSFVIRGLKIISGEKGLFVSMPSKKKADGSFQDVAHPINTDTRMMIEKKVLKVYHDEINSQNADST
ncbi:MAG: septation regulator SpoVG [candidate division Zixibacteria bacterium]|nr:septation regulator SpoVG [candidate division Zixibacteria bacterium]